MPGDAAPDPYRVWLSEVMLQQTTVAAVTPRFERFVARWPTVEALAAAKDEDVLSEWAGLGYYARARNLIACARKIAKRGAFPDTEAGLRELPGIGNYTAAAIAAIAFDRRALVMDTNVERVIARLKGIEAPVSESKALLRQHLDALTPQQRSGDFAQAMMDLGATICRPRNPDCGACPLQPDCAAFASGEPARFPAPKTKKARPVRHGVAHWIERNGCIWLVRRATKGMLGGMAALPGPDWTAEPQPVRQALGHVTHVFTHFRLELDIVASSVAAGEGWWQPLDGLVDAGLPTLYRSAVDSVLESRSALAA
ncbi:MAG: A/G-specific adenine glycosylase [Sphingomonas sp.]|nr:A/G-specific adenine glycosylase [Sphingomonas sp.]